MSEVTREIGPLLRIEEVDKSFGKKVVFEGLDLSVERGERLAIVGRSGAGKSVLLKLLLGLLPVDRGRIVFEGRDLTSLPERELRKVRLRLGMVFQGSALFDSMTVFDNVAYGLVENGWSEEDIAARVQECLALVDLRGTEPLLPEQLSGGMKKRVAIARAAAPRPDVLCYDEPTTGLDPQAAGKVIDLITKVSRTALVVTHDMDCVFRGCERIVLLERGHVVFAGSTRQAQEDPPEPLRRFLGEEPAWRDIAPSP